MATLIIQPCKQCGKPFEFRRYKSSMLNAGQCCSKPCANAFRKAQYPKRFWAKINKDGPIVKPELGPCWLWLAGQKGRGYGAANKNGKQVGAHCLAYELTYGQAPRGLMVLHKCDNPTCVNPSHLYAGTCADNMRDKVERKRQAIGDTSGKARLRSAAVLQIRHEYRQGGTTYISLAQKYGVAKPTIGNIIRGVTWRHLL